MNSYTATSEGNENQKRKNGMSLSFRSPKKMHLSFIPPEQHPSTSQFNQTIYEDNNSPLPLVLQRNCCKMIVQTCISPFDITKDNKSLVVPQHHWHHTALATRSCQLSNIPSGIPAILVQQQNICSCCYKDVLLSFLARLAA